MSLCVWAAIHRNSGIASFSYCAFRITTNRQMLSPFTLEYQSEYLMKSSDDLIGKCTIVNDLLFFVCCNQTISVLWKSIELICLTFIKRPMIFLFLLLFIWQCQEVAGYNKNKCFRSYRDAFMRLSQFCLPNESKYK